MTADATVPAALDPAGTDERPATASRHRPWTPDRPKPTGGTVISVKRACNGCGNLLGDVTDAELERAVAGLRPEDVRAECPSCSPSLGRWHPDVVRLRARARIGERGAARTLAGAYTDPGQYCERRKDSDGDYEPVHEWASRAVALVTEVVQAEAERDGSIKVLRALASGKNLSADVRAGLAELADRFEKRSVTLW